MHFLFRNIGTLLVAKFVLSFLNDMADIKDINGTYITLVPKIKDAREMTDFRPISLCNVVYKLISFCFGE